MSSFSDAELKRRIAKLEADLRVVKPGSWTAGKIQESLDYYRRELAKARSERQQFERGTL